MIVFHGSYMEVEQPLALAGRANLDFGHGFYITDVLKQAQDWAKDRARKRKAQPVLNVYELDMEAIKRDYRYLGFPSYNRDWLHFVVGSRTGSEAWKQYDVIEGGVADDSVIDTVEGYMAGQMSEEYALNKLIKAEPNNQICLLKQEIIDKYLTFKESINL